MVSFRCLFMFLFIGISVPYSHLQAQDPDEEGEISWGDEEEYELEEDEFADEEEFLDDDESVSYTHLTLPTTPYV